MQTAKTTSTRPVMNAAALTAAPVNQLGNDDDDDDASFACGNMVGRAVGNRVGFEVGARVVGICVGELDGDHVH